MTIFDFWMCAQVGSEGLEDLAKRPFRLRGRPTMWTAEREIAAISWVYGFALPRGAERKMPDA